MGRTLGSSMVYRIKFMEDTVADRDHIKAYLSKFYPGTEKRFFSLLRKKIARLKSFPFSCLEYEDDVDYRILVVNDYLVFRGAKTRRDYRRVLYGCTGYYVFVYNWYFPNLRFTFLLPNDDVVIITAPPMPASILYVARLNLVERVGPPVRGIISSGCCVG